jgi:hypothetical protein
MALLVWNDLSSVDCEIAEYCVVNEAGAPPVRAADLLVAKFETEHRDELAGN